MATPTNQEMLDAVKEAIQARLTGGAVRTYSINGRDIEYYSLTELYDLKRKLERAISADNGNGRTFVEFVGPDDEA